MVKMSAQSKPLPLGIIWFYYLARSTFSSVIDLIHSVI
jgi:hypothetical protein